MWSELPRRHPTLTRTAQLSQIYFLDGKLNKPSNEKPRESKSRKGWRLLRRFVIGLILVCLAIPLGLRLWQWTVIPADAPIIGVSYDTAWHARIGVSITNYEVAVTTAGGRILELRPESADAESILNQIDARMLTGGGDINPELYNGDASSAQLVDAARDDFELELIRGALKRDMPILGICRGIQIINVAQGGTLRNLRDDAIHSQTHNIGINSLAAHDVELTSDSKIAQMMGVGSCAVNSFHGQAVDKVGRQLVVTARASDGVIECLEMPSQTFVVCTQWHPEIPLQQTVMFEQLISEAKKYRANRKQISK